ncbi:hypothetical protein ACQ856_29070 (plasmid) [Mycolicibacterium psychrotolerans]|uniref:hypothetical protein n=1 Tax=Mycolicibacterium psychrotolerans TaxID=216929 RepID=UPI003D6677B2
MVELLIRASLNDRALLRRAFGINVQSARWAMRPDRIVVDAHVPMRSNEICDIAQAAGVGYLIDPLTHLFQDHQPTADRWAQLPFGLARALTPEEASRPAFIEDLTHRVLDYQLRHNATALIPPYVYVDRPGSEWVDVQATMWQSARHYLDARSVALPITAVVALGWRMLHPTQGFDAPGPAERALVALRPREIAIAASKADDGIHPEERAMDLALMVERLSVNFDVLLWQQGRLGELAVAAGARGYETGVGWRERCDMPAAMRSRRDPDPGYFPPRPVYVAALGQSVARRSLDEWRQHRDIWTQLICTDANCCPTGGSGFIDNAAAHTIIQRAGRLRELAAIDRPVWRWQNLAERAERGLAVSERINRLKAAGAVTSRVNTGPLEAIRAVSDQRRHDQRSSGIA